MMCRQSKTYNLSCPQNICTHNVLDFFFVEKGKKNNTILSISCSPLKFLLFNLIADVCVYRQGCYWHLVGIANVAIYTKVYAYIEWNSSGNSAIYIQAYLQEACGNSIKVLICLSKWKVESGDVESGKWKVGMLPYEARPNLRLSSVGRHRSSI